MKAVVLKQFGGTEQFELREVPDPVIRPGEVMIQVRACAFNPIDFQMRQGLGESKLLKSAILGRELSGLVTEPGSSQFKKGDPVFAYIGSLGSNGSYAQYVAVPEQLVAHMPAHMDYAAAAAVPMSSLTALQCVERLPLTEGDHVLVSGGAGGVGSVLIKLLQLEGINHIVSLAGNAQSRAALLGMGLHPDAIIDYHEPDLANRLIDFNKGHRFDHCIDIVGGRMSELCAMVLKINGNYADIAALGTELSRELLFDKSATIYNIANYAYASSEHPDDWRYYGEKLSHLVSLLEQGKIPEPAIKIFSGLNVDSVAEAHRMLEQNQSKGRKLVMEINQ